MGRPKKEERFRICKFRNPSGKYAWRVTGTSANGERVRENHRTRLSAQERRLALEAEFVADGTVPLAEARRTTLSEEQLRDAEAAVSHLHAGQSLVSTVTHYRTLCKTAAAKQVDLAKAIEFFSTHFRPETEVISVANARKRFIESKAHLSAATREHYTQSTKWLLRPNPNRPMHDFSVNDLEKILAGIRNDNSYDTVRGGMSVFFNWAERRKFLLENPMKQLERRPKKRRHVVVLSFEEVQRLLTAAMQYASGMMAPSIALMVFAGLRPSEVKDLDAADVRDSAIRVKGGKLKRLLNRSVPVPAVLDLWLREFPFKGRPVGWQKKWRVLKSATEARQWVNDVLRHTSITYQVERDKDLALVAFNNGTSTRMIDQHYRDVVEDPATVDAFWQLSPEAIRKAGMPVALPATAQPAAEWPSNARLAEMVASQPLTHVASQIGVSDNAVRKRCLKFDIPLPGRSHQSNMEAEASD